MMLCDHCDAAHHIYCLEPPLEAVPEGTWMCPRCVAWLSKSGRNGMASMNASVIVGIMLIGAKVLSANAEEEARQQVDGVRIVWGVDSRLFNSSSSRKQAASRKIIKIKKKKYLVKWRGLSYRDCTWETAKDINDDEKIAEYHQLNDAPPDEPPLTQAEIGLELAKDR